MYFHISFNTWLNFTRRNQKRENHYLKQEKVRNKCIKEGKTFTPVDYQEEKELLQYVTIEVDEVVYYTSEEAEPSIHDQSHEQSQQKNNSVMKLHSMDKSQAKLNK